MNSDTLTNTLLKLYKEGHSVEELVNSFSSFVKKYGIQAILPNVLRKLEAKASAERQSETLIIRSAKRVTENDIKSIQNRLGAMSAPVEWQESPHIKAGFMAEYRYKALDGTLGSQLGKLRKHIMKS